MISYDLRRPRSSNVNLKTSWPIASDVNGISVAPTVGHLSTCPSPDTQFIPSSRQPAEYFKQICSKNISKNSKQKSL